MRTARFAPALALLLALAGAARAQQDPAQDGSWLIRHERLSGLPRPDGKASTLEVVLPVSAAAARPTILFLHGWSAEPRTYMGLVENLATRGFAVAMFDQLDRFELDLSLWIVAARGALDALERAQADPGSPLFGELDLSRLAVLGHSYGGATTVGLAAVDPRVQVAVALTPGADRRMSERFQDLARRVRVPLLVIGCELDPVVNAHVWAVPAFRLAPASDKLYLEIARGEHNNFTDLPFVFGVWRPFSRTWEWTLAPDEQRRISRRYANAWIEAHLGIAPDPAGLTDGRAAQADFAAGTLSRWAR